MKTDAPIIMWIPGSGSITPVEVARFNDVSVWKKDHYGNVRRQARFSDYNRHYDSYGAAREWMLSRAQLSVKQAEASLEYARKRLAQVEAIPTEPA